MRESADVNLAEELPALAAFEQNAKQWRAGIAEYMDIPLKDAKKEVIRLIHLAAPRSDLPFLWALVADMRRAV
eukprot:6636807-Karenia_brevis.AAC.1